MSNLKKKKITVVTALRQIKRQYFRENQAIEALEFQGLTFTAWKFSQSLIRHATFSGCIFEGCIFDRMDLQRVIFNNCTFRDCVFSPEFRFITGEFQGSTLENCDFPNAFIQNVRWFKARLKHVDFRFLKAKSISFPQCTLSDVVFDGANITRGDFRTVPGLKRETFYNVTLDDCDFDWNEVFVVMQFNKPETENLYEFGILPVLKECGIETKRVDRYEFRGRITDEILQNLVTCRLAIAEASAANKNVFFEIGFALGRRKDVILLVDKANNIPFDLKDYPFIIHGNNIKELKRKLRQRVRFMLEFK